jgi:hypothetical protein
MKSLFVALNFFNSCTTTSSNLDGDYDGRLEVQYGLVSRINCHDTETILVSFTSPPDSDIRSVGSGKNACHDFCLQFFAPKWNIFTPLFRTGNCCACSVILASEVLHSCRPAQTTVIPSYYISSSFIPLSQYWQCPSISRTIRLRQVPS